MSIGIMIGLLIILGVTALALRPLFVAKQTRRRLEAGEANQELEELLFQREVALLAIRDAQLDHAMGKLSEEDFTVLDAHNRARAIDLLRRLDELGVGELENEDELLNDWIERAVADLRAGKGRTTVPSLTTEPSQSQP